jgi:hypothetical protein
MSYISAGMGMRMGTRYSGNLIDSDRLKFAKEEREEYINAVEEFINSDECPTHYQYLLENIYGGIDNVRDSLEA